MSADEIRYALYKQIPTMREIMTDYGTITLDFDNDYELWESVADALRSVLAKRLETQEGKP